METETQLKFIDLCAGIGGGRLGMERAGFKCIAFSEINEAAIRTYRLFHNTKGEVKIGDLTKIYPPDVPGSDTFEFPKPTGKGDLKNFLIDNALWAESVPLAPLLRCLEAQEAGERKKTGFSLSKILADDYLVIDPSQFNSLRFFRGVVPTLIRVRGGEMCYVRNGRIRRITGRERLLLQGFTMEHFEKAKVISNDDLINQTGNAMSVNVIEAIAKKLHAKLVAPLL